MALAPIQLISDFMEDYPNYWLKFYEQGTTTPLAMAIDQAGSSTVAKAEISAGPTPPKGLIKTAGNVTFIPYLDKAYDAYIFPTEAEADANDTVNAIQLADNVSFFQSLAGQVAGTLVADMVANEDLTFGDIITTVGYLSLGDGGDNTYEIGGFSNPEDGGEIIDLDNGLKAKGLFPGDRYNFKQWGAPAVAGQDSTDAVEAAIAFKIRLGKGIIFDNIQGQYDISRSIIVEHPTDPTIEIRNMTIRGQGGGGSQAGCTFNYTATSVTDPANFQNGIFDLRSVQFFHFEGVHFLNNAVNIDQLVKVHAVEFNALSAFKVTFEKCQFQNSPESQFELNVGHVLLFNALDVAFRDCRWFGGPINVVQGVDPATQSGIANGFTSRTIYDTCYFTGDVVLNRCESVTLINSTIAERWLNPQPFMKSAQLIMTQETWSANFGINLLGCSLEGHFAPGIGGGTAGAIVASDFISGLNIIGCTFGSDYTTGVIIARDSNGVIVQGCNFDLDQGVFPCIQLASTFIGSFKEDTNLMTSGMVAAGGELVGDSRVSGYNYPHLVNQPLVSNYDIVAPDTFEKAITSAAVSYKAGRYKMKASCLFTDLIALSQITIRITNTDGYSSTYESQETVRANEQEQIVIEDDLYIDGASAVTWSLEVMQGSVSSGTVKADSGGGVTATYLQVTRV